MSPAFEERRHLALVRYETGLAEDAAASASDPENIVRGTE